MQTATAVYAAFESAGIIAAGFASGIASFGVGAVLGFIGSKILGGLFGSKKFYEGEFATRQRLINSVYVIETLDDGTQALVATNPEGSVTYGQL